MSTNKRFSAVFAATIALSALAAAGAHAQSGAGVSRPLTIKLGAFTPSEEETRAFSGDTHFLLDATWEFGKVPETPLYFGAYFDYIFQTSATTYSPDFDDDGSFAGTSSYTDRASAYGLGLQARYVIPTYGYPGHSSGLRPYFGGGVGFYGAMGQETLNDNGYSQSRTTTGLGGKLMFGVQSRSGFLGEVSYHFIPTVSIPDYGDRLDLSGYGFSLGYRF